MARKAVLYCMHAQRIYSGFIKAEQENPSASTIPRALPIYAGTFRHSAKILDKASMRNTHFKKYAGLFRQQPNVANRIRLRRAASNAHVFNKISYAGLFRQQPNVANRIRLRRAASNAHVFNKISYAGLSKRSQRGGLENPRVTVPFVPSKSL